MEWEQYNLLFPTLQQIEEQALLELNANLRNGSFNSSNLEYPEETVIFEGTITEDGIQIALDWNDAFVKFLKAQGVVGVDDTQIVQHWLAMIAKQTSDRISEHYNDLEGKISEFE